MSRQCFSPVVEPRQPQLPAQGAHLRIRPRQRSVGTRPLQLPTEDLPGLKVRKASRLRQKDRRIPYYFGTRRFFIHTALSRHLKDKDSLPPVIVLIQLRAVDLIHKLQSVRSHKSRHLSLKGIIKEQIHLSRILIIGLLYFAKDGPQDLLRKWIEEINITFPTSETI